MKDTKPFDPVYPKVRTAAGWLTTLALVLFLWWWTPSVWPEILGCFNWDSPHYRLGGEVMGVALFVVMLVMIPGGLVYIVYHVIETLLAIGHISGTFFLNALDRHFRAM